MNSAPTGKLRCAITGANGYVGSRLARHFRARGWEILALTRRTAGIQVGDQHVAFELGAPVDACIFASNHIDTLIHCAYDFGPLCWPDCYRINVLGSERLLRSAREGGVKSIIFLSSISAFEGCSSMYGKAKLQIEAAAADVGGAIIRSGLVYGDSETGGMFAALRKAVSTAKWVPLVGSGRYPQYLVHEEDLCNVIHEIAMGRLNYRGPLTAACAQPWPMRELLQELARLQGKEIRFVNIPWRVVWSGLKLAETIGIGLGFRSDSVLSLVKQNPAPHFDPAMQCRFRRFGTVVACVQG